MMQGIAEAERKKEGARKELAARGRESFFFFKGAGKPEGRRKKGNWNSRGREDQGEKSVESGSTTRMFIRESFLER